MDAFLQSANMAAVAAVQARKPQPKKPRQVRWTPLCGPLRAGGCAAVHLCMQSHLPTSDALLLDTTTPAGDRARQHVAARPWVSGRWRVRMQPAQAEAQTPPSQATEEWICPTCKWPHPMYHSACHGCGHAGPKGSGNTRPALPEGAQAERKVRARGCCALAQAVSHL